jgi:hypothetical protein
MVAEELGDLTQGRLRIGVFDMNMIPCIMLRTERNEVLGTI